MLNQFGKGCSNEPQEKEGSKRRIREYTSDISYYSSRKKQMCATHCSGKVEKLKFAYLHGFPNVK